MKSKIVIFETGIEDGIMSNNKKFYPENMPQEKIDKIFLNNRLELGKKYNFDGRKIFRATQKNSINKKAYPDGQYIVLNPNEEITFDAWYKELLADIIILPQNENKIVLAHQMADCPILIAEDRKLGVTALSHCGAVYINRLLPQQTILTLQKEYNSNLEDIFVYIGSCAHKENYVYEKYPYWATNNEVWEHSIKKETDGLYHIDMLKAITNQLNKIGIKNIEISPNDTISHPAFYSHAGAYQGRKKITGQNLVGFYYKTSK